MEEYTPSIGSTFVMTFDPFLPLCCGSRVTKVHLHVVTQHWNRAVAAEVIFQSGRQVKGLKAGQSESSVVRNFGFFDHEIPFLVASEAK